MQNILKAIELKRQLELLQPINNIQEQRIMQKFRLDWNYHSNHLEGNSLTFGETKNLILHGITAQGKPLKDHFEITGHNNAINLVLEVIKGERPLTESFIREIHTLVLKEPHYKDAITLDGSPTKKFIKIGEYKTTPNHVKTSTGELFRFAEPEETPALMGDLMEWYQAKNAQKEVNPILLAAEFHYKFIRIHPFDDGNGRTVRIIMNFILMRFGYPPVVIKTEDKNNYFFALRQADNGDIEFFVDYIAKNLVRSLELMIAGAKGENIEEPDDIDKSIVLLEQKLKGFGEKADTLKSKNVLRDLFELNLFNLIEAFVLENEKFQKFYASKELVLRINHVAHVLKSTLLIGDGIRKAINEQDVFEIGLTFHFQTFLYSKVTEHDYNSSLYLKFNSVSFEASCENLTIKSQYKTYLSANEMTDLITSSLKKHTKTIEQKIKEFEEKNKSTP